MKRVFKRILMVPVLFCLILALCCVVLGGIYFIYLACTQFFNTILVPYGKYIFIAIFTISVCGYIYTLTDDIVD